MPIPATHNSNKADPSNEYLAFSPANHCQFSKDGMTAHGFGADAIDFNCYVQSPADDRFSGFKDDQYLWMHHMLQMSGMEEASCQAVKAGLGDHFIKIPDSAPEVCSPTEAYFAGEIKTFKKIADLIKSSFESTLTDKTVGQILFLLACLIHGIQDRKHLDGAPDGINSLEHFTTHLCQFFTDIWPSEEMSQTAIENTELMLERFEFYLMRTFFKTRLEDFAEEALQKIKNFKIPEGKSPKDYYPDDDFIKQALPAFKPA